jgi:hypothetical protein
MLVGIEGDGFTVAAKIVMMGELAASLSYEIHLAISPVHLGRFKSRTCEAHDLFGKSTPKPY